MTATQDPALPHKITAASLAPGHVIYRAGGTNHSPITVTAVVPCPLPGFVAVHGFNARDTTPRCMFRSLQADLPITLAPSTGLFRVAFGIVTYAGGRTAENVALTIDARDADAAALRAMDLIVTDHKAIRPAVKSVTPVDAHPLPGVAPVAVTTEPGNSSKLITKSATLFDAQGYQQATGVEVWHNGDSVTIGTGEHPLEDIVFTGSKSCKIIESIHGWFLHY